MRTFGDGFRAAREAAARVCEDDGIGVMIKRERYLESGDIAAAIRAMPVPKEEQNDAKLGGFMPLEGAIYRHSKTGRYYRVLMCARQEHDQQHVTIYQHIDGTMPWVRPTAEFGERFDYVPNGEIPDVDLRAAGIKP